MRYVFLLMLLLVLLGTGGFVWFAWHGAIAPITPPARSAFDPAAIDRGARLAALGDCISCHTVPGGTPFAGGRGVQTPFGTIYASNITPDPATGIGAWSEAAFRRAMHEGVDRDGHQLYPAFPYDHFTLLTEADDADLYAFLMTRAPVQADTPSDDLPFPLNIRALLAGWKLLFFRPASFQPDPAQSAAWNRGAYLAQGLAHCGACHTPRNFLGAEKSGRRFAGGDAQGWSAYALDAASPAPEPWTADAIYAFLRRGWQAAHGVALGPMGEVTHNLAGAPDDDVRAIATYVASFLGTPQSHPASPPALAAAPGEALYRGACASCHEGSRGPPFGGIDLGKSRYGACAGCCQPRQDRGRWHSGNRRGARADHARLRRRPDRSAGGGPAGLAARPVRRGATLEQYPSGRAGGPRHSRSRARGNPMRLNVNGHDHDIDVDPDTPLLYVLRDDLGLNAAKYGCGLGQCGACTVLVDKRAVFSCVTPVVALAGKQIETLESLGNIDHPGPVQAAFIEEQAAQCGYCIAGMAMRAEALLRRNPNPSDAEIRAALQPNLCRCGTHMRILRAVRRAATAIQAAAESNG